MKRIDIPTAITEREIQALCKLAEDKSVLEIGSLTGYSTIRLAQVAKHVTSIDPHIGYPRLSPSPSYRIFRHNLERYNIQNVTIIKDWAQNVLPLQNQKFDLVFIDLTGQYEPTKFCLENANAKISTCHDFSRRSCEGVNKAILEFTKNKTLRVVDTLAIIT